jgi:hypothetical protein
VSVRVQLGKHTRQESANVRIGSDSVSAILRNHKNLVDMYQISLVGQIRRPVGNYLLPQVLLDWFSGLASGITLFECRVEY